MDGRSVTVTVKPCPLGVMMTSVKNSVANKSCTARFICGGRGFVPRASRAMVSIVPVAMRTFPDMVRAGWVCVCVCAEAGVGAPSQNTHVKDIKQMTKQPKTHCWA